MSNICTTLEQNLKRAERERVKAHVQEAVRDTLRTLTGHDFCPYGGADSHLHYDTHGYRERKGFTWQLSGPWQEETPKALQLFYSLYSLMPVDAHHFWLWPYYNELKRSVTFFPGFDDPYADHKMCQPYYWQGHFPGNADQYRRASIMELHAMYTFPLTKAWCDYLRTQDIDPPIAITLAIEITQGAYRFPGLDLSRKVASPAGKKVYGYYGELRYWNVIRWHGGYYQGQNYPDATQIFWNACADGDCDEEWK